MIDCCKSDKTMKEAFAFVSGCLGSSVPHWRNNMEADTFS